MVLEITPKIEDWLLTLRNEKTRATYLAGIEGVLGKDVDQFLTLAEKDHMQAERQLLTWIRDSLRDTKLSRDDHKNKGKVSASTLNTWLFGVRSLCDHYELPIRWKNIRKACPSNSKSQDRAPSNEEIRKVYAVGREREKFATTLFTSSGIRVGALDYMEIKDFAIKEVEGKRVAVLTVYRGEPEAYTTFASSECVDRFEEYISHRARLGENVTLESKILTSTGKRIGTSEALRVWYDWAWKRAGFNGKREFKEVHGFRKFFKTKLENAGMKTLFVETLLGHNTGLHGSYQDSLEVKPQLEMMAKEYVKVMHVLAIEKSYEIETTFEKATQEVKKSKEDIENQLRNYELEILKQRREIQLLREEMTHPVQLESQVRDLTYVLSRILTDRGVEGGYQAVLEEMEKEKNLDRAVGEVLKRTKPKEEVTVVQNGNEWEVRKVAKDDIDSIAGLLAVGFEHAQDVNGFSLYKKRL